MGFASFLVRRIINMAILLLLLALFNYFLFRVMPGNVVSLIVSPNLPPSARQALLEHYGLAETDPVRAILHYLYNLFQFDFGNSFVSNHPVWFEIETRIAPTLLLLGVSAFLSIMLGIVTGVFASSRRGRRSDVTVVTSSLFLGSLPTFWIGLVFILLFAVELGSINGAWALPSGGFANPYWSYTTLHTNFAGFVVDALRHLILPAATLTIFLFGGYTLLVRNTFLDVLSEDYILTARAKGVRNVDVLYKHAFRNAVLPLATSIALQFGGILGGAALTETVYSYQGLGFYIVQSVGARDWPVLQGVFFLLAITTVVANFSVDLVYAYLDPRVRL